MRHCSFCGDPGIAPRSLLLSTNGAHRADPEGAAICRSCVSDLVRGGFVEQAPSYIHRYLEAKKAVSTVWLKRGVDVPRSGGFFVTEDMVERRWWVIAWLRVKHWMRGKVLP